MNRKPWHAAAHGVSKSWTRLRDWAELSLITWQMNVKFFDFFKRIIIVDKQQGPTENSLILKWSHPWLTTKN